MKTTLELFLIRSEENEKVCLPDGFPADQLKLLTLEDYLNFRDFKEFNPLRGVVLEKENIDSRPLISVCARFLKSPKKFIRRDLLDEDTGEISYDCEVLSDLDSIEIMKSFCKFLDNFFNKETQDYLWFEESQAYYKQLAGFTNSIYNEEWKLSYYLMGVNSPQVAVLYCLENPDGLVPDINELIQIYKRNFITEEEIRSGKIWAVYSHNSAISNWLTESSIERLEELYGTNNFTLIR